MKLIILNCIILTTLQFLVHYLKTLEDWVGHNNWIKTPVARTAWSVLQDFHHDPAIISYPPQAVAIAAVKISMDVNGAQVPLCEAVGKNNWQKVWKYKSLFN